MPPLCRLAPVLALVLSMLPAGCAESHRGEVPCDCCGIVTGYADDPADCPVVCAPICAAHAGPDGGTPLDPSCGPRMVDLLCLDHVRAGRPTEVEVILGLLEGACFCDQGVSCSARITGDFEVELTTQLCPETPLCRACEGPPTGTCTLPALTEGTWHVVVNGEDAYDLAVAPADVVPEPADVCIRRAIQDGCGGLWEPEGITVGRACHDEASSPGTPVPIRLYDACGGCVARGPCEVTVLEGTIRVRGSRLPPACDITCPPSCEPDEHVCYTPPLEPGDYRVVIEGLAIGEPTTLHVEPGATGPEVCAGG